MDFKELKEKAKTLKEKAINYWAKKISDSNYTINKKEELDILIKKSKTTTFKNSETWIEKKYKHRVLIIFANEWSSFYRDAIYILPIIVAKAFSQNIIVKLAKTKIDWVKLEDYQISEKSFPCLVVFEEEKVIKIIESTENILKLVKSFDLDINKQIDEFKI